MHNYQILGVILALATCLPLAWKWQLGLFQTAVVVLAESALIAMICTVIESLVHFTIITGTLAMWWGTLLASFVTLLILFLRDPDRVAPDRENIIVSPADGRVIYVRSVEPGEIPEANKRGRAYPLRELAGTTLCRDGAVAIGISMNFADVHVNRAPISGQVSLVDHVHGIFGSLRNPEMVFRNERATTIIATNDLQIAVVQIASRLVRRIITFASEGDALHLGQRIGVIRFGSQVDLLIPRKLSAGLAVQVGDRVVAGRTIMVVINSGVLDEASGSSAQEAARS